MKINKYNAIFIIYIVFLFVGIIYNNVADINSFTRVSNDEFFNFKKVIHYIKINGFVYILL
ncbi:hypothetical protein D3G13_06950, partial [Staphylococcus pseudintermedius]|nr:hypothetical protein [Staphylococcus pseudintermedius]